MVQLICFQEIAFDNCKNSTLNVILPNINLRSLKGAQRLEVKTEDHEPIAYLKGQSSYNNLFFRVLGIHSDQRLVKTQGLRRIELIEKASFDF